MRVIKLTAVAFVIVVAFLAGRFYQDRVDADYLTGWNR